MTIKEIVLNKIADGRQISQLPKSKIKIDTKIFHYREDKYHPNGKYPFNINPNTLSADFEVWICGDENTFYVIPIAEIQKIYDDPETYANTTANQENIRTLDIHVATHKVKYGKNKQVDFSTYKNKTLSDYVVQPIIPLIKAEVTERKYGSFGEGVEHLNFKNEIAENPSAIGIYDVIKVENDNHVFPSADRPDIIFTCNDNKFYIIEIEIENCLPGAYQAIKYKSLFCAEKGLSLNADNVKTMLVARKINSEVKEFCSKYQVVTIERPK